MHSSTKWLVAVLIVYVLLGGIYSWATPPLESSDEYKHYPVVHHIANTRSLVVLDPENPDRWLQEGAQPPLYYLLMAVLTAPIDTSDLPDVHRVNKHAFVGDVGQVGNKNLIFHDAEERGGTVWAVYLIRFVSLGLGVGTVVATFGIGRLLFNNRIGLFAAALTAFNPMFLFTSAAVNNDSLANLLGTVGLLLLVRIWRREPTRKMHILLGIVCGLGMLTKLSLGGLLLLAGIVYAWRAWQQRRWQILFVDGVLVAGIALLLVTPMLIRNWQLYGDVTALNVFVEVQGSRAEPMVLQDWVDEFGTFYRSYWGLFGGVNIATPQWFYYLCNVGVLIGLAGWIFRREETPSGIRLLVGWGLILFALLIRWTLISPAFQGRLLFPALGGLNVLWAVGLLSWSRRLLYIGWVAAIVAAGIAIFVIEPVYKLPDSVGNVSQSAEFGPITFTAPDGSIALVGVHVPPDQNVAAGGDVPVVVKLYWQAVERVSADYVTAINVLGRDFAPVGRVNRHPANGAIPTSEWGAGQIWHDVYHVYVGEDAEAPNRLRIKVDVFDTLGDRDPSNDVILPAHAPNGDLIELLLVGEARLQPSRSEKEPAMVISAEFEQSIILKGYEMAETTTAGATLPITLTWQATATPIQDYTVFVQLLDADGVLVGSADAPPINDNFPTSLWRDGDTVVDVHELTLDPELPSGSYKIAIGLYDPHTGIRLSRLSGSDFVELIVFIKQ